MSMCSLGIVSRQLLSISLLIVSPGPERPPIPSVSSATRRCSPERSCIKQTTGCKICNLKADIVLSGKAGWVYWEEV